MYIEHLTLSKKKFVYYEIWISSSKIDNLKCTKNNDYQFIDFIQIHWVSKTILPFIWEFRIWATKTEIPFYKQPKIEESSNLLD
jgi:hypothetical protein